MSPLLRRLIFIIELAVKIFIVVVSIVIGSDSGAEPVYVFGKRLQLPTKAGLAQDWV